MALTTASFQDDNQPPRDPRADRAAGVNAFDAVRPDRMRGVSEVASDYTSSNSGESAIDDGFINGSTLGEATTSGGVKDATKINGDAGFPGLFGAYAGDQ